MWKLVVTFALLLISAIADAASSPGMQVSHAWMRATPPGASTAAGYLTLTNTTTQNDRLLSVSSELAERVELHTSALDAGLMRMRKLDHGLALPAGGRVMLAPSATHLMFIAPHKALVAGQVVTATLHFAQAPPQQVRLKVMPLGVAPSSHGHDMSDMKM